MPHVADWDDDPDVEILKRAGVGPSTGSPKNDAALALRVLRDYAPLAAHVVCAIATESDSEKLRLAASKYILDRVIGPITGGENVADPWSELFDSVVREPTATERAAGSRVSRS
jgi:hypothetical protein